MGKYETPDYEVHLKEKDCEIRRYTDFYVVEYENLDDHDLRSGFGTLFKYISSDNQADQKIPMTVPVIKEETTGTQRMAFVVPKKFRGQIPEPNSPNLKIQKFDEGLFAAIRYTGRTSESKELKMKRRLARWLQVKGYEQQSDFMQAFFSGPFTPPMLKHNEIWVRVSKS
ncbi:hypothetical protein ADIAL_0091 [Alkalibacterium sp. AK22]|uniref:SOUL family heme-binding protein n=1 Tax=Alkalibacterium sp. AK22 TaxID=1229520 RepID=UPI0004454DAF|nr:heme-binding protein [Alkalibacterium sp. AK22]EXJ24352.1 hypothetical protein ADIAL_0091 [Alkalibacterium sp. AK22]